MHLFLLLVLECELLEIRDSFWFFSDILLCVRHCNWPALSHCKLLPLFTYHCRDWQKPNIHFPGLSAAKSDHVIQFCPLRYKWKYTERNVYFLTKENVCFWYSSSLFVLGTWKCKDDVLSYSSRVVIRRHEHEGNKKPTYLKWQLHCSWNYLHLNFFFWIKLTKIRMSMFIYVLPYQVSAYVPNRVFRYAWTSI